MPHLVGSRCAIWWCCDSASLPAMLHALHTKLSPHLEASAGRAFPEAAQTPLSALRDIRTSPLSLPQPCRQAARGRRALPGPSRCLAQAPAAGPRHEREEERVHDAEAAAQARVVRPEEDGQHQRAVAAHERADALRRPARAAWLLLRVAGTCSSRLAGLGSASARAGQCRAVPGSAGQPPVTAASSRQAAPCLPL